MCVNSREGADGEGADGEGADRDARLAVLLQFSRQFGRERQCFSAFSACGRDHRYWPSHMEGKLSGCISETRWCNKLAVNRAKSMLAIHYTHWALVVPPDYFFIKPTIATSQSLKSISCPHFFWLYNLFYSASILSVAELKGARQTLTVHPFCNLQTSNWSLERKGQ